MSFQIPKINFPRFEYDSNIFLKTMSLNIDSLISFNDGIVEYTKTIGKFCKFTSKFLGSYNETIKINTNTLRIYDFERNNIMINDNEIAPLATPQETTPGYNARVLNYMQGTEFKRREYSTLNIKQADNLAIISEIISLIEDNIPEFDVLDHEFYVAGGFPLQILLAENEGRVVDESKYSDYDLYIDNECFKELKKLISKKENEFLSLNNPNINFIVPNKKKIQFISRFDVDINKIIDSYDFSICKCFIDFNDNKLYYDNRLNGVTTDNLTLHFDHINGTVGKNRSFERLQKYIDRYNVKRVEIPTEHIEGFIEWKKTLNEKNEEIKNEKNQS